ncbi:hypothetical protein I5V28_05285 [Stenotrophomonas maltophilia]|nr:hypothetical protein [Stenotrophomonas maltophilia]
MNDINDAITPAMVDAAAGALAKWAGHDDGSRWVHEARDALEAALAARQPVGEPVARVRTRVDGGFMAELLPSVSDRVSNMAPLYLQPPAHAVDLEKTFQAGVAEWMGQCFLPSLYSNMTERGDRLLEEVLELLQAHGYDRTRVSTLVDYVFGRPVGEPAQEVGGVMVTLAGYCWVAGLDMQAAGDDELARINQPEVMAKIRAKQEAKNALHFDTPLPGNTAARPAQAMDLTAAQAIAVYDAVTRRNFTRDVKSDEDKARTVTAALIDRQAVSK